MRTDPLADCFEGLTGATTAPPLPLEALRPVDVALLADVLILLAVIAVLYFSFKLISGHPWIPTSIALAILFYAGVDERWWNTASVVIDGEGVQLRPHVGADVRLTWGEVHTVGCEGGSLFPIVQDDTRLVLLGRDGISKIEIPRFLDRYPELATVVVSHVPAASSP